MSKVRPDGCRQAEVIQVIKTTSLRGKGEPGDEVREVIQYWSMDGELLAESDPTFGAETRKKIDLVASLAHGYARTKEFNP